MTNAINTSSINHLQGSNHAQLAQKPAETTGVAAVPTVEGPTSRGTDQFAGSTELNEREHGAGPDLSGFASAYGEVSESKADGKSPKAPKAKKTPGQEKDAKLDRPATDQEKDVAKNSGKSVTEQREDRKKDQEIIDHVCGKGCGCGSSKVKSADPLKALEERDVEVRQHEQEHLEAAGEHAASGPVFETTRASDGRSYVTGGHVQVNTDKVSGDPVKTLEKMKTLEKAALRPAEPSAADRRIASESRAKAAEAFNEITEKRLKGEMGQDGKKIGGDISLT